MSGPAEYAIIRGAPGICPGCYLAPAHHAPGIGAVEGVLAPRIVCPSPILGPGFPRDEATLEPLLLQLPYAYWEERWLFLAACVHLMATNRAQSEPVFHRFAERWPSGRRLLEEEAAATVIVEHFRPIGLWNMRAQIMLNAAFTSGGNPERWTGYPREAWRVLACLDTSRPARDRKVEAWRRWAIHRETS